MDVHFAFDLSDQLSDPAVRDHKEHGIGPTLLDAHHPGQQQRQPHGTGNQSHHHCRNGLAGLGRIEDHRGRPSQQGRANFV